MRRRNSYITSAEEGRKETSAELGTEDKKWRLLLSYGATRDLTKKKRLINGIHTKA